jgi:hypothetical protein
MILGYFKLTNRIVRRQTVADGIAESSRIYFIESPRKRAFSMGELIFVYNGYGEIREVNSKVQKVIRHEYGHAMQSVRLGWLYLPVIGLPSLLVTGISSSLAERCYFEKWADKLAAGVDLKITDT